ncbi:MAG: hypothetical protein IPF59_13930 [Ignavibacteria bacterium]|nr:hypothetical protein [Ignavibacteria bacterium]
MCIRLFAAQHLSAEERFALNVITSLSDINAALVVRCHKILRYNEVERVIRDLLIPQQLRFLVMRGYGVDPVPHMDRDDVSPDMSLVHCVPTTLIVVYGYREGDDEILHDVALRLKSWFVQCTFTDGRVLRCGPGRRMPWRCAR